MKRVMPDPTKPESAASGAALCPEHGTSAKWVCGGCGRPVCPQCGPTAYDFKVFHPHCLEAYQARRAGREAPPPLDVPSPGVKLAGWTLLVQGMVLLGSAMLLLGIRFLSRHYFPMPSLFDAPVMTMESLPAGRTLLVVLAGAGLLAAVILGLLGAGLLNAAQGARRALLVLSGLRVAAAAVAWTWIGMTGSGWWDIPVLPLVFLVYFNRPSVRRQFERVL